MTTLFTATIIVNGAPAAYDVTFENERYHFHPQADQPGTAVFALYRDEDEWKTDGAVDAIAGRQAAAQLDDYLLQQH